MAIPRSLQLLLTSLVLFSARNVCNALSFTLHFCMLNHLVWRYVCVLLISKRTGSHRSRKHKKENYWTSTTPASALVAVFSSSPPNFSRALNVFEKHFFTTLTAAPLALHRVSVMRLTPWPVTEVRTSQGWWRRNSNKRSTHPKNGIHINRSCMNTRKIQRVICTSDKFCFFTNFLDTFLNTSMQTSHHCSIIICLPSTILNIISAFL